MKKSILFAIALLCMMCGNAYGASIADVYLNFGTKPMDFEVSESVSSTELKEMYGNHSAPDVSFRFTLTAPMDIVICHCGSTFNDTWLYLLNDQMQKIDENDDSYDEGACQEPHQAYLSRKNLQPGTYYVVSEAMDLGPFSKEYFLKTTIKGTVRAGDGNTMASAINIGTRASSFDYSDTRDTRDYANNYPYSNTNNVFYKLALTKPMDITVSHRGNGLSDTYVRLLRESGDSGSEIFCNDNSQDTGASSNPNQAYLKVYSLPVGNYYIISEGKSTNGVITTNLSGQVSAVEGKGDTMAKAIDLGKRSSDFTFRETQNTLEFFTDDFRCDPNDTDAYGNDLFYKLTLTKPMDITVTHGGSEVRDTYVHLLNASGGCIAHDNSGYFQSDTYSAISLKELPAGTYYVVSEGYSYNDGPITTTITGKADYEPQLSASQNYIRTIVPTVSCLSVADLTPGNRLQTVQYFDGLGRPQQTVQVRAGQSDSDLVTYQEYDAYGRMANSWLPAAAEHNDGAFVPFDNFKNQAISTYADDKPYAKPVYEDSPLNRIAQQYGPGAAWQNAARSVKTAYLSNMTGNDTLNCVYFKANEVIGDTLLTVTKVKNYDSAELFVTRVEDEDGNASLEFTDKLERVVLNRKILRSGATKVLHDTYYLYDEYSNLLAVLPPMAANVLAASGATSWNSTTDQTLKDYAYLYKYDRGNRCRAKKLPGCSWNLYIYDKAGRMIFSQDGEQRKKNQWAFELSDALGRSCVTGLCRNTELNALTGVQLADAVTVERDNSTDQYKGYALSGIALNEPEVLAVNYYDDYQFLSSSASWEFANADFAYEAFAGFDTRDNSSGKGLLTGTLAAYLEENTDFPAQATVMYYDRRRRVVQTLASNHLYGMDRECVAYNFTGQPLRRMHIHTAENKSTITQEYGYTYDNAARITQVTHKLNNNAAVTLAQNTYDNVGRLLTKKQQNAAPMAYSYNLRSWLTGVTHHSFAQKLYYNSGNGVPSYNGNISSMTWKAGTEEQLRGYKFAYDGLNRLVDANYGEGGAMDACTGRFNESISAYDKQGNILAMQRYGKTSTSAYGIIDNLTFAHKGNQLKYVNDAAPTLSSSGTFSFVDGSKSTGNEYAYDANGNLTQDLNKNIAGIQYNSLNLPQTLQFANGNATSYLYGADGVKKRVSHQTGSETIATDYCSNVIYENGNLSKILITDGYITMSGSTPAYHYYLKDYQGNNRVVMSPSNATEQVNHYYPFGGLFTEGIDTSGQPYKYNRKELDRKNGLDWYDYQARMMDPNLGFMPTIDPLCEKFYSISPYAYCANNPVRYVDPDGKEWRPTYDTDHEEKTKPTGYEWVEKFEAYNEDGTAKKGIYVQAIFFSDNGNFDASSKKNMGSSTATVYLADGTMQTFDANTYPSGDKYATVPEGMYHATVGKHKGSYPALRMSDTDGSGRIALGVPNPAHPERTYAEGINIHKPGGGNLTGTDRKGRAISAGCLLVDINNWNTFINLFDNDSQRENTISVTVSRSLTIPVNANRLPAFNFILNGTRASFFNRKFK